MSRARKGVVSEGKGVTQQEDVESDSSSELLAKIVAVMEEKFLGFGKRLDSISERLEQKVWVLTSGKYKATIYILLSYSESAYVYVRTKSNTIADGLSCHLLNYQPLSCQNHPHNAMWRPSSPDRRCQCGRPLWCSMDDLLRTSFRCIRLLHPCASLHDPLLYSHPLVNCSRCIVRGRASCPGGLAVHRDALWKMSEHSLIQLPCQMKDYGQQQSRGGARWRTAKYWRKLHTENVHQQEWTTTLSYSQQQRETD